MSTSANTMEQTIRAFLERIEKLPPGFDASTPLYSDGAGLDSLDTAELLATLEDEHGIDPFLHDTLFQTMGEILAAYDAA